MMAILAAAGLALASPPVTRTVDVRDTLFGTVVPDPYRWLEDAKSPEVQSWMSAQDAHTRAALARLPAREALRARLRALASVEQLSTPYARGGRLFFTRRPAGAEKSILFWRASIDAPASGDRVLIDPATLSADGSTAMKAWSPSWNGRLVAYGIAPKNADEQSLKIREVETGRDLSDVVDGARWSTAMWDARDEGFYYTFTPPAGPGVAEADRNAHAVIKYHRLGTPGAQDPIVRGPTGDASHFLGAQVTQDGRWLLAMVFRGWSATDVYLSDTRLSKPDWKPLIVGRPAQYSLDYHGGLFYVRTDDGAPRGRVVLIDPAKPAPEAWKTLIAEDPQATLESAFIVGGRLVVQWTRNATSEVEVRDLSGTARRRVDLPKAAALEGLSGESGKPDLFYAFSTLTQPLTVMRTSVEASESREWGRLQLPLKPEDDQLVSEQVWYTSRDGTKVSMFLVHRRDLKRGGDTPFLLTGYGGFSIGLLPQFSPRRLPWLEAGGGLAIPNLRGGSEYGEDWHKAGMREKKQNVFDDFIAAAEHLVKNGYTSPKKLVISGRSNGGLLVGAALTQRPDLFRAVICGVPLLDMVRYHRFGTGMTWVDEYGSSDDEPGFKSLFAYSPYHHVKPGVAYPSVLFLSADTDDRVDPLHARKMAAALQAATKGGPVLLRIERNAGHGGADKMSQEVEEDADVLAFAMDQVGLK